MYLTQPTKPSYVLITTQILFSKHGYIFLLLLSGGNKIKNPDFLAKTSLSPNSLDCLSIEWVLGGLMEENGSGAAVIHLYEDITIFTALPFTICQILKMLVFVTIKIDNGTSL